MAISQRQLTLAEFLELPEEEPALEYEAGVVKQKVSPKGPHSRLQFWLARLLDSSDTPSKRAAAFTEARVTFGGNSLVPDVVVYRWERIPRDANGRVAEDFTTPPDIAVEILSPGQSQAHYQQRCRWYVEQGVPVVLLVNPRNGSVGLFRRGHEVKRLTGNDQIDLAPVLPGIELSARELFDALSLR